LRDEVEEIGFAEDFLVDENMKDGGFQFMGRCRHFLELILG
jgi:hypothetical protein